MEQRHHLGGSARRSDHEVIAGRPARVIVVGLGPGDVGLVNAATRDAVASIERRFLRTTRHPSAAVVGDAASFDDVYEHSADLDEVYRTIVERLVEAAIAEGTVLYAVPGSPVVAERTVELLSHDPRVTVEIVPAMSFLDLAWARLRIDPIARACPLSTGSVSRPKARAAPVRCWLPSATRAKCFRRSSWRSTSLRAN